MATTRKYLNHLLQNTGITPACSEEERAAAEDLAQIFANHGFDPEIQEFNASGTPRTVTAILGVVVFLGAVLMGIGGIIGIVGLLLTVAAGVLYVLERMGKISFSGMGASGLSQNVIAYHQASGPLASPRNRPVVVVAHYDSPRADLFSQLPYATYKPIIVKLMPYLMVVPAILAIVRLLPFPGGAKVIFWLIAIIAALVPLANAIGIIANRFILPYTSGSVCNKSSVASMLGVMDAVAPFEHGEEFPHDVPFEDYFSEQLRMAREAEIEAAVASGDLPENALQGQEGDASETSAAAGEDAGAPEKADDHAAGLDATLAGTASIPVAGAEAGATAAMPAADVVAAAGVAAAAAAAAAGAAADASRVAAPAGEEGSAVPAPDATAAMPAAGATAAMPPVGPDASSSDELPADEGVDFAPDATTSMPAIDEGALDGAVAEEELEFPIEETEEEPIDAEAAPAVEATDTALVESDESVDEEPASASEPEQQSVVNAWGNYRYGEDVIRAIGMVPENCTIEYDLSEPAAPEVASVPVESAEDPVVSSDETGEDSDVEQLPVSAEDVSEVDEHVDVEAPVDDVDYGEADDVESDYVDDQAYDYDEYADYGEYEDDDEFAPVLPTHSAQRGVSQASTIAETLSAVGARASRFFDGALRKGKSMLESMTSHDHEQDYDDADAESDASDGLQDSACDAEKDVSADGAAPDVSDSADTPSSAPATDDASAQDVASAQDASDSAKSDAASPDAEAVASAEDDRSATPSAHELESTQISAPVDVNGETQAFTMSAAGAPSSDQDLDATVARTVSFTMPASGEASQTQASPAEADSNAVETVDSLMAQITAPRPAPARPAPARPAPQNRVFSMVPDPSQPSVNQMETVNRASLFDLPDPSDAPVDPFAAEPATPAPSATTVPSVTSEPEAPASSPFSVISSNDGVASDDSQSAGAFETITADAPSAAPRGKDGGRRGLGKLFHRKKQDESSMSDWLGVEDDFDAKSSGRDIGSWDNFEGDDWKGGATGAPGTSVEDLRDAVTSMGDDELLGHDIWFVATGASEFDNAGIQAFLDTHRDKLRGVFLINLESVGAGDLCMLATEGGEGGKRVLKGDKRIMNLVRRVSGAFHREFATVEMPYLTTDAYRAMSMSLRSLTIAGIEGNHLACSHSEDDLPYRINEKNVRLVADVVTEVIRRS